MFLERNTTVIGPKGDSSASSQRTGTFANACLPVKIKPGRVFCHVTHQMPTICTFGLS